MLIGIICNVPKMLIISGNEIPKIINNDCLENNPIFLIENFNNKNIPMKNNTYVYRSCKIKNGPYFTSFKFNE